MERKDKKPKVASISPPFLRTPPKGYGGIERVVANLAKALSALNLADVTLFAADGSKVDGVRIHEFGPATKNLKESFAKSERAAFERSRDALVNGDYDVIHDHTWNCFVQELRPKLLARSTKIVHTHHGSTVEDQLRDFLASKQAIEHGSHHPFKVDFVAISKAMQRLYRENLGLGSAVVYNGIDTPDYPFRGISSEKRESLAFIGRIDPNKQPHIAIQAAKRKGMRLDLVGGTLVRDTAYLNWIRSMCDGKQILLHENAPQSKKFEILRQAKALIFPSNFNEPFGLVAIEANASGVPVIATPDGAIPEIITPGLNGYLTKSKADCVDEVVGLIDKIDSIKPADCRHVVETRFSKEVMAKSYAKMYAGLSVISPGL